MGDVILKGTLEEFELCEILQILYASGKDGVLVIIYPSGERAEIYVEKKKITHVTYGNEEGEFAVVEIFEKGNKGEFKFITGITSGVKTLNVPIQDFILGMCRKIEEWQRIKKFIPSFDLVFELEPEPPMEVISFTQDEWRVLNRLERGESIREIARNTGLGEITTARILMGLLGCGLIRVKKVSHRHKIFQDIQNIEEKRYSLSGLRHNSKRVKK